MCFRKDELIVQDESEEDDDNEEQIQEILSTGESKKPPKQIKTIEETHELTEEIECKVEKVNTTLKQMDKFMNQNLEVIEEWFQTKEDDELEIESKASSEAKGGNKPKDIWHKL